MHRIMDDQPEVMDWTAIGRRVRQAAEMAARLHEEQLNPAPHELRTIGLAHTRRSAGPARVVRSED